VSSAVDSTHTGADLAATDHPLGPVADIPPGEGRAYAVDGEQVAVFRLRDGSLRATSAVCPHRGGPLADGQIDDRVVLCPLHLNAFDLTSGECLTAAYALRTYPVRVDHDGTVVVATLP
jgi:nitrite reductase/ring-hydroxylating ferredoxin subunit